MTVKLSKEILGSLPAADSNGVARVSCSLRLKPDGESAEIVEINDLPVPVGKEGKEKEAMEFERPEIPSEY